MLTNFICFMIQRTWTTTPVNFQNNDRLAGTFGICSLKGCFFWSSRYFRRVVAFGKLITLCSVGTTGNLFQFKSIYLYILLFNRSIVKIARWAWSLYHTKQFCRNKTLWSYSWCSLIDWVVRSTKYVLLRKEFILLSHMHGCALHADHVTETLCTERKKIQKNSLIQYWARLQVSDALGIWNSLKIICAS